MGVGSGKAKNERKSGERSQTGFSCAVFLISCISKKLYRLSKNAGQIPKLNYTGYSNWPSSQ